jgi:hypothetical protein
VSEILQIPIPLPGYPLWDERITLDGREYILRFDWHDREACFYFDVLDVDRNVITAGIKIIQNWALYTRETAEASPKGNFLAYSPDKTIPQLADFGLRSILLYFTPPV